MLERNQYNEAKHIHKKTHDDFVFFILTYLGLLLLLFCFSLFCSVVFICRPFYLISIPSESEIVCKWNFLAFMLPHNIEAVDNRLVRALYQFSFGLFLFLFSLRCVCVLRPTFQLQRNAKHMGCEYSCEVTEECSVPCAVYEVQKKNHRKFEIKQNSLDFFYSQLKIAHFQRLILQFYSVQ